MSSRSKKLKIFAFTTLALLLLTVAGALIGYWMVVPSMAEDALRQRMGKLEQRAKLIVSTGDIQPNGLQGIKISQLTITDPDAPEGHQTLLQIESLLVDVDKKKLLTGQKVISSLTIDDATLYVHRDDHNLTNIERILDRVRATSSSEDEDDSSDDDDASRPPSFLRHFGGQWPELDIHDASITFSSDATPFPLDTLHTDTITLDPDGTQAHFKTTLSLDGTSASGPIVLPTSISSNGTLAVPLEQSSLSFNFDRPFRVTNIPMLPPSLQIGLSDVELSEGGKITLTQLTLEDTAAPSQAPLLETERAFLQLEKLTTKRSQLRPLSLSLEKPRAHIHILEDGSIPILSQLLPSPPEALNQATAPTHAAPTSSRTERLKARLRELDLAQLARLLPNAIDIEDAYLSIQDDRPNTEELVHFASHLELREARLDLDHDAEAGSLSIHATLEAFAGSTTDALQPRGALTFKLSSNYKTRLLKLETTANAFDLSLVSQLTPISTLARHLKGGILNASLEVTRQPSSALHFKGDVAIQQGHFIAALLAEEPLTDWSLGYAFEGTYDADAPIPPAKLLTTALDANVPEDPEDIGKSSRRITIPPPTTGALVLKRGTLRSGDVRADITPAFYGLDRDKPLPARMDLGITLPPTPIQELLDATPDALLGHLSSAKIDGSVKMNFLLEVPLYDASSMVWRGEPETSNATITYLPPEVDVREMVNAFTHTIEDESVLYSRTIKVPSMQLIPSQWLADNAGLEPEQIDRHWERGGWIAMKDGLLDTTDTPRYRTASKPWSVRDDARIIRHWKPYREGQTTPMVSEPYGPYTFVPLQHISHWLIRAILTTEDNSFFKHDGFNRLAFRQSVERDLAEGDYVRGASTISMQLIKNLYLTRKKVMARKIQEALLVWLMESVVQVPKGRMLEIYLNIIEFAPGVFGIHDAAVHYFGKRPDELTLAECAWLVTIVPGPKFYHKHFMRGEMSDYMFERIKRYMSIMHKRERVSEEELTQASLLMPQFHQPELLAPAIAPLPEPAPVDELEALFPDLFGPSSAPSNPLSPTPQKVPLLDPKPQPLKNPAPTPRAQPDPAPPTLKLH